MKVNNISMDTVDCNLSLAILKYCEWNQAQGVCYAESDECKTCCANQLLDIVFNGDRDINAEDFTIEVEVTGIIPVKVSAICREDAEELAESLVDKMDLNVMTVSSVEALRKD